ncbi:serine hydrolase domain-containing protein [Actinoplanes aureus]|uniref:Beta-lactamase family protein n=1 Tax=Actinoplanes aureus TaxID=2792083 RepID=A0A931C343_9ACTN|nr:serine hydrolase domain-containing protein [Actinoplanes aureus]MBG0562494.1 beta-lactamase family protein [Actinoplanes aureus]
MRRVLISMATALAVLAAPAAAATAATPHDELQRELDRVTAAGAVGVLAEVRDEHGTWRGSSGSAIHGTTRPVPVHGRFRAGSITKTFVATVVLQLAEEGRLRLDDTIETWLPGTVPGGDRITLRRLLNHTGGVPDVRPTLPLPPSPEFFANRWRTRTAGELIQRALTQPVTSPGSFKYSNTGYLLLGEVIEKAGRGSYGDQIERRIIRPLGLHGTSMPGTSPRIPGAHSRGYVPGPDGLVDYTEMNPSLFGASGELISTAADLRRFFDALLSGRLVKGPWFDEMLKPGVRDGRYGLGLAWRDTDCGIRVYGNDGDALAYQSYAFTTADRRRQVTVALTPDFTTNPDNAVNAFLNHAFCR